MIRAQRCLLLALLPFSALAAAQAIPVKVVKSGEAWQLLRAGKPYFIKGAGGDHSLKELAAFGGNSVRTWGAEQLEFMLPEAQRNGITVCAGIWLQHSDGAMDYNDPVAVKKQFDAAKAVVEKYRDNPAVLVWGIGNEMEGYKGGDDAVVWKAIQDIAKMVHQVDPNHPTMTVIAEIGTHKITSIHELCPDIDIVGVNTYGGAPSMADRYKKQGGTKPYIVTEFGPLGQWEVGKTGWGAPVEPTSTQKANHFADSYKAVVLGQPNLCLGSYAFTWGHKQEATATWFGMFLSEGQHVGSVDVMSQFWTGKPVEHPCPIIEQFGLLGPATVAPGSMVAVTLKASCTDRMTVKWVVQAEQATRLSGGAIEPTPRTFPEAVGINDAHHAAITAPMQPGQYRIFVYIYDEHNGAATANIPFSVAGG